MVYHFRVKKDDRGGYYAECIELEGCQTQGDTLAELEVMMKEALDLYLSEPLESDVEFPMPKKIPPRKGIIEVAPSARVAFTTLLRAERKKSRMTQKQVATALGFSSVYAYQKLESPSSANPGLDTLSKLIEVLPNFKVEKIFG